MGGNPFADPGIALAYCASSRDSVSGTYLAAVRATFAPGERVFEIGSGAGANLAQLRMDHCVMGSDAAPALVAFCRARVAPAPVLRHDMTRDPLPPGTRGVISNKVLQHIENATLARVLAYHAAALGPGGRIVHSFWIGKGTGRIGSDTLHYRTPDEIRALVGRGFRLLSLQIYGDLHPGDSVMLAAEVVGCGVEEIHAY